MMLNLGLTFKEAFFSPIKVDELLHAMKNPLQLHKCDMSNDRALLIIQMFCCTN